MIKADFHLHTDFSTDSDTPMERMIEQGIQLGLDILCFTDHIDLDYDSTNSKFIFDLEEYFKRISEYKEKYKKQISLRYGMEFGLQKHLGTALQEYGKKYPFDFIIGSSHLVRGKDPYYPEFFVSRSEEAAYREYFVSILENLEHISGFDIYGHLDYIVRYGPNKAQNYSYKKYSDVLDEILKQILAKNLGLEVNTGGYSNGLAFPNPHPDILKRYQELGGEIVTIGSDAHTPLSLAKHFHLAEEILKSCGFRYYTVFQERKPSFLPLSV